MNLPQTLSTDSLKELYNESKKRVKIIINLLTQSYKNNQFSEIPDQETLTMIANLAQQIAQTAKAETMNPYRDAILKIAKWIHDTLQKEALFLTHSTAQNTLLAIKKGAEILHSFLHRDLRRKQFSSEENESYQNYIALIRRLSNLRHD